MGWENVFHCEWNEFGQRVLKYYWPNAISYNDITKTDFTIHRGSIDILTGGFPCQPYSSAGKRKGKADDRHLWPEMLRAIQEIQPVFVVGENVSGLINWDGGLVFHEVQTDLENEGYEVLPVILPAAGVDAPHKRDRVWFVSYSKSLGGRTRVREDGNHGERKAGKQKSERFEVRVESKAVGRTRVNPDSQESGLQGDELAETFREQRTTSLRSVTELHKIQSWYSWPLQSPVCDGDYGLSSRLDGITFPKLRKESIKAGGNAIVPQVALQIFKAIEQWNQSHSQR